VVGVVRRSDRAGVSGTGGFTPGGEVEESGRAYREETYSAQRREHTPYQVFLSGSMGGRHS
jgi:hypothetical protein